MSAPTEIERAQAAVLAALSAVSRATRHRAAMKTKREQAHQAYRDAEGDEEQAKVALNQAHDELHNVENKLYKLIVEVDIPERGDGA